MSGVVNYHGMTAEKFKERQNCEYIRSNDGTRIIFANGAAMRDVDEVRGCPTATDFSEPPVDDSDELSLRRRLLFLSLKHEREVEAYLRAKSDITENIQLRQRRDKNFNLVPAPSPQAIAALEAGAARIAAMKARADELVALIEALPSSQAERERLAKEAQAKADVAERDFDAYRRVSALRLDVPQSLKVGGVSNSLDL